MLRTLALAARQSCSNYPRNTFARALAAESADAQTQKPPKPRGNSEFVKRRWSYRDRLHEQRIAFTKEIISQEDSLHEKEKVDLHAVRQARAERRRVKSEAKQARAKELLEETRKVKEARQIYRKGEWEYKQIELAARRAADLQQLVSHAHEWITEDTLQEHVDRAVDEFFIEVREEEQGPRVVGW